MHDADKDEGKSNIPVVTPGVLTFPFKPPLTRPVMLV